MNASASPASAFNTPAELIEELKAGRMLMVNDNTSPFSTNFTVSIEAAEGVTTGISAHDRAKTVRTAVKPDARPEDLIQPGHIFPLMAQPGGVLTRAGHTEAGCDLARLAGRTPAAVIVEILNEDGTMARRPDLERFAQTHGLKMGTIADLIRYRLENEHSIERVAETQVDTEFGSFHLVTFQDTVDNTIHLALVKGAPSGDRRRGGRGRHRGAAQAGQRARVGGPDRVTQQASA